jgi:hypothetical protein
MSSEDVEIHLIAYDEASDIIMQIGSDISGTFSDIEGRTQDLVTTTNDATSQITMDYGQLSDAGQNLDNMQADIQTSFDSTVTSMNNLATATDNLGNTTSNATTQMVNGYNQANDAGKQLQNSQADLQDSSNNSVTSLNSLAMSSASLAMSFMMVENRQVAVDRANLMAERSTATLQKAQEAYNVAIEKFGSNSDQAKAALDKLNIAQDAYRVSVERADMTQRNLDMTMVFAALSVIPSFIAVIGTVNNLLPETISESMLLNDVLLFMEANPLVLVIAGLAALVAALVLIPGALNAVIGLFRDFGDAIVGVANLIGNAWNGFVGLFTGGNKQVIDSLDSVVSAGERAGDKFISLSKNVSDFATQLNDMHTTVSEADAVLSMNASTLTEYQTKTADANDAVKALDDNIAGLTDAYTKSKAEIDKEIVSLQAKEFMLKAIKASTTETQATIDELTKREAELKNQLDYSTGALHDQKAAVEAAGAAAKEDANFISALTTKYDDMKASADTNLSAVKAAFDNAFNAGEFNKALGIVQDFAKQYGLTLTDAEKIIDNFKAAQAKIPQTIEEELIGKAQADLATFQKCATGKFANLQTDSSASFKQIVTDTNDLISNGLVGQAQTNIQAFVTCATSKHDQLVSNIEADLAKLRAAYAAGAADVAPYIKALEEMKLAATFDPSGSNNILAAIKLAGETAQQVASQTTAATAQVTNSFQDLGTNVWVIARQLKHNLVGGSVWTDMLTEMENTTEKSVAKIQAQFQGLKAESLTGGGFGVPEALPGPGGNAPNIFHIGELVHIDGSADKATVDLATRQIMDKLKSIVVEQSASYSSSTQKRIRQGSVTY